MVISHLYSQLLTLYFSELLQCLLYLTKLCFSRNTVRYYILYILLYNYEKSRTIVILVTGQERDEYLGDPTWVWEYVNIHEYVEQFWISEAGHCPRSYLETSHISF